MRVVVISPLGLQQRRQTIVHLLRVCMWIFFVELFVIHQIISPDVLGRPVLPWILVIPIQKAIGECTKLSCRIWVPSCRHGANDGRYSFPLGEERHGSVLR